MYPLGFYRDKNGELSVQNIKVSELAKKYGTPLYIYDSEIMKERYDIFFDTVKEVKGSIHYAVKANDSINVIKFFSKLGCGADIVSIGEFEKCIAAGVPANKIIFSGVGKAKNEIEIALRNNILQFNIESEEELYDIHYIASKIKKKTKFGIDFQNVKEIYKKLHELDYISPVGLGVHIGSQIFDFNFFNKAYFNLKVLADDLRKRGFMVPSLDLGGGIGVDYKDDIEPNFIEYKRILSNLFLKSDYKLSFEPGRSLIAQAGILVTKVIRNKKTKDKNFIIVDAAMNNLIRPTLYDAYHKIEHVEKSESPKVTADIVGPICETGDYLALERNLNYIDNNKFLAIKTTGAYSSVMSSNYNSRADAVEVMIVNNKDHQIKKIDTIKDIIAKEKLIDFD